MKHVGKQISTEDKLVVVFREVPGEPDNCLVVKTRALGEVDHDGLMAALEGLEGQQANQLADILHTHMGKNGRPILETLHKSRKIMKLPTDDVALTPDSRNAIPLNAVNDSIRANDIDSKHANTLKEAALSNEQIADSLQKQADSMETEAKRLRKEAKTLGGGTEMSADGKRADGKIDGRSRAAKEAKAKAETAKAETVSATA